MSWKKIKNQFRKCEHCSLYYIKKCPYDGIFNYNWYKSKKCNKLMRKKFFDRGAGKSFLTLSVGK